MACQAVVLTPLAEPQQPDIVAGKLAALAAAPTASTASPPTPSDASSELTELESYQSTEVDDDQLDQLLQQQQPSQKQQDPQGMQAAEEQRSADLLPHPTRPLAPVPSRAALAASPDYPVLVTADKLPGVSVGGADSLGALPVNNGRPIPIKSSLFRGQACIFIVGLSSSPPALFEGQRRRTLLVVQGQFLDSSVGFDDLATGQEFERVRHLPPAWLLDNVLLKVARAISPSMQVGPSQAPFMLMPVVAGCNCIHVAAPGQQPALGAEPEEDMRLVDATLAANDGSPLPFSRRRSFFSDPANRRGRSFDTGLVWTFYFYQHLVDVSKYTLNMVYRFHLPQYLDGQPLQLMMKDTRRGRYLLRLHMWHEQLLGDAERQAEAEQGARRAAELA